VCSGYAGPGKGGKIRALPAACAGSTHKDEAVKHLPLAVGRLVTAGLLCAIATAPAFAQAVKGSRGAILSKEELRACLAQKDAVDKRRAEVVANNEQLTRERDALQQTGAALRTEGSQIEQRNNAIRALAERNREHQAKVQDWNGRAAKLKDAPPADQERLLAELNAEKDGLQKNFDTLKAEQAQLSNGFNEQVAAYNARAQEHARNVEALNARATQLNEQSQAEARDRDAWRTGCADRRYREDDETAIKRGK
jgi:septal ring factor EnvC (AmiA/AmiB activator)